MRKRNLTNTSEALQVNTSVLKIVHSKIKTEKLITRNLTGPLTLNPRPVYYPASYSKDGPVGNYQGL
ncbi:hypothetical protein [Flaviaesturariibacter amylovorans]|uniref:Uncharacterized protein n=1 Tax=Flaviaesturariibacter amylovorans TaxID=1084520 RepID=A0ABP8GFK5_9BACT